MPDSPASRRQHNPDIISETEHLAQTGVLFLFDLGYFKIQALARLATAGAYFLTRLNHQTTIYALYHARGEAQ
jgi:hypothetical protein